jgi:hypothetical protein
MMKQELWEEKQERKLERYSEIASRSKSEAIAVRNNVDRISDAIPFGSPILVGHHSERHHRRDLERINNGMRKSIELDEKAEHYKEKVKNLLNPTAISSDNPDAIALLKQKLINLEAQREKIKAFNKTARQNKTEQSPSYMLSNLSGNIKNVKDRIEKLEKLAQVKPSEEVINGITVKVNPDENRVQVLFPDIPSEETRNKLKSNGFRWSPYNKAWQRQISRWALDIAKKIAGEIK